MTDPAPSAPAVIQTPTDLLERVVVVGDLAKLTSAERLRYYSAVCESVGLNPLTRPLDYITLNGRLTLYVSRGATDQLRKIHGVNIERLEREVTEGMYVVTAYARDRDGRTDSSIGAVAIDTLKGETRANAMMKSETKAKRRVTLSICGLGLLDETEVDTIPAAVPDHGVADMRDQLIVQIGELADAAGWDNTARLKLWQEHFGATKPAEADPAKLAEFLAEVRRLTSS
jgi:hypothetical protein